MHVSRRITKIAGLELDLALVELSPWSAWLVDPRGSPAITDMAASGGVSTGYETHTLHGLGRMLNLMCFYLYF